MNVNEIEFETAKKLTKYLIDQWNDQYPTQRVDPHLINFIREYMVYAYVAGYDDYRLTVERALSKSINGSRKINISIYKFRELISAI